MSFSSGYYPQTNGQVKWANQDLGAALRSATVTARNPSSWKGSWGHRHGLEWIEYTHNSLSSTVTGMRMSVLWVTNHLSSQLWRKISLFCRSGPIFVTVARCGGMLPCSVRLTATGASLSAISPRLPITGKDLPLKTCFKNLTPHYVGPYKIDWAQVTFLYCFHQPCFPQLRIHSPRASLIITPPVLLDACRRGRGYQYLVD